MKNLLAISFFSIALATGGAMAQGQGAGTDRPTPGETRATSPADGVMNTLDGFNDRGSAFFTDEGRTTLRTDDEINTAYGALTAEQRAELETACASPAEGMGAEFCNKIKR